MNINSPDDIISILLKANTKEFIDSTMANFIVNDQPIETVYQALGIAIIAVNDAKISNNKPSFTHPLYLDAFNKARAILDERAKNAPKTLNDLRKLMGTDKPV